MKKCPFCAEDIQEEAIKCKHCGEFLKNPTRKLKTKSHNLARTKRQNLRQRGGWGFDFEGKRALREALHNAPIGDSSFSSVHMLFALILYFIPPFFFISGIIMMSEHSRQLTYWVDTGKRFQKTLLYKINRVLDIMWAIAIGIFILVMVGLIIYGVSR